MAITAQATPPAPLVAQALAPVSGDPEPRGVTLLPLAGGRRRSARGPGGPAPAGPSVDAFACGPENRLCAAAIGRLLRAATDRAQAPGPSPVTLIGPSGVGKSHLAHAVVDAWNTGRGSGSAACVTAADFARRWAGAVEDRAVADFRRQTRSLSLLALEDLHRLTPRAELYAELAETLDAVQARGGVVLLTSLTSPASIGALPKALLSRLAGGLLVEVAPPGPEAAVALLALALRAEGCPATAAGVAGLARALPAEPLTLLRAAAEARSRFAGRPLTAALAGEVAAALLPSHSPPAKALAGLVARRFGVSMRSLLGPTRRQSVVQARAVAIYLMRTLTPLTYVEIGTLLGGRDHKTIIHNFRRVERSLASDPLLAETVADLARCARSM